MRAREEKESLYVWINRFLVPVLGFVLALVIVYAVMTSAGIYLGGELQEGAYSGMISDSISQYVAYYRMLRRSMQGEGNLFYSMEKIFGGSLLSLVSYYLFSPFDLLLIMFPNTGVETLMVWMAILKISTAGLTAGVYLTCRDSTKNNGLANAGFALAYALCGFAAAYCWDIFWLDGFLILPLVALGIEKIAQGRGFVLYVVSLFYALVTSWYTGFMICVFAVVYFLSLYFSESHKAEPAQLHRPGLKRMKTPVVFLLASLAGGFMALPLWSSLLTGMGDTRVGVSITSGMRSPWDIIRCLFTGSYFEFGDEVANYNSDTYVGIFVGGCAIVFCILYFFSSEFTLKRRMLRFAVIAFYVICMIFMPLDSLMHGGARPNWFPARYAFCLSFLLVATAADGYAGIRKVWAPALAFPAIALGIGLAVAFTYSPFDDYTFTLSMAGLGLYLGSYALAAILRATPHISEVLSRYLKKPRIKGEQFRKSVISGVGLCASVLVVFLCGYGVYLNTDDIISTNAENGRYNLESLYSTHDTFQDDVDNLKAYAGEDSTYRMENTWIAMPTTNYIDNDPLYYGFNGISGYSSTDKRSHQTFMRNLGFFSNYNFTDYRYGSTISANSLLSIRYIMDNGTNNGFHLQSFLDEIDGLESEGDTVFYENPYALPLAFAVDDTTDYSTVWTFWVGAEYRNDDSNKTYWLDLFEWQNRIYQQFLRDYTDMDGEDQVDIFQKIDFSYSGNDETGYSYPDGQATGTVRASSGVTRTLCEVWEKDGTVKMLPTYDVTAGSTITYTFTTDGTQPVYWYFKDLYVDSGDVTYVMDGTTIQNDTYWYRGIVSFNPNRKTHTLQLRFNEDYENLQIRDGIYVENLDTLEDIVSRLKENSVGDTLVALDSSLMEGTLHLEDDHPESLFVGLPYESGLRVYLNGKKLSLSQCTDIFTSADISGFSGGDYDITIRYVDTGFTVGIFVSGAVMVIIMAIQLSWPGSFTLGAPLTLEGSIRVRYSLRYRKLKRRLKGRRKS